MVAPHILVRVVQALCLACICEAYTKLSDDSLRAIPDPGNDFDIKDGKLLSTILQPRVPGSSGSTAVLNHFVDFFKADLPAWKLTFQNSTSKTPVTGNKEFPFVNLIATRDPPWTSTGEVGYLTLVAHYDSKRDPEGFIGAIDSAAPCAMLMHTARSLESALTAKWAAMDELGVKMEDYDSGLEEHQGIQIMFLDGEEAFGTWTDRDSIYGARSLAAEMEATIHPAMSTYHNALSSISLFVLLDLLGSSNPNVPSYFKTTHWAYKHMKDLQDRLHENEKLKSFPNHPSKRAVADEREEPQWFPDFDKETSSRWFGGAIGDDHVPFMARGVNVLHMIPSPFPSVWHDITDDGDHLDLDTCADWAVLVTAFAAEWLDLEGHFGVASNHRRSLKSAKKITSKTEL